MGLLDKLHSYGFYTDEQVVEKTKEIKALRSKGGYYLDDDQTTDIFLQKLQILYQDYLPIKGFNQIGILEVITGLYMTKIEVVDE